MVTEEPLGPRLRRIRKSRSLSSATVAEAVGINASYLCSIERNPSPNPRVSTLLALAKYYEMTLDELVGHVRKEPSAETKRILYWYENVASEKERRIFYRLVDELRKTWA
jgi:transcriptional regulator with XRE-family HTH domain